MKKMICILLVLFVAIIVVGAAAESYGARVLTPSMNVYLKPDASTAAAASLNQGTAFTVTGISGDWARISYKGREGFVQMKHVIFDKHVSAVICRDTEMIFITKDSAKAGKTFRGGVNAGSRVYVVGKSGKYLLIKNQEGSALGVVKAEAVKKLG